MAQIGIKLADHSFYPVLDDDTPHRKRMVLTVAQEGQQSVQVDVVRRTDQGDQAVGCLVLEELPGDTGAEIEFFLGIDASGNVDARVNDSAGGQFQSFSVNLGQLDIEDSFTLPEDDQDTEFGGVTSVDEDLDQSDLDLPGLELPDIDLPGEIEDEGAIHDSFSDGLAADLGGADGFEDFPPEDELAGYDEDEGEDERAGAAPRPFNIPLLLAILLISLSLLALGAFGIFSWLKADSLPELRAALLTVSAVPSALL